ncbi:hypothetical protein HDU93_003137, partial [Gonapodya sp. JEL0774]
FQQSYWAMPDHVQQDLISVVYPSYSTWKPMWMRNVGLGEAFITLNSSLCPNGDTASAFNTAYQNVTCRSQLSSDVAVPARGPGGQATSTGSAAGTSTSSVDTLSAGSGSNSSNSTGGLSVAVIAGIVAGSVLGVALLSLLGVFLWRRRGKRTAMEQHLQGLGISFSRGRGESESRRLVATDTLESRGSDSSRRDWVKLEEMMGDQAPLRYSDGRD